LVLVVAYTGVGQFTANQVRSIDGFGGNRQNHPRRKPTKGAHLIQLL
jgi:hypothetical protein